MPLTTVTRTTEFCRQLRDTHDELLPETVAAAARRSLFNVVGTAVGAAHSPAAEAIVAAARDLSAPGRSRVLGRMDTFDEHWAALLTGTAGHYDDFDDTHLATVIHPGAATLGALVAVGGDASGSEVLAAFALGCEVQLRIGNAISPNHYDRGWHITGTCGVFGAAVAAGLLLGLDGAGLEAALAAASTMTLGHRDAFGSMTKPFHAGKAAANGVLAARLALAGYRGVDNPLGDEGVLTIFADAAVDAELFRPWTSDWELERNTFKPYPCGIVAHPSIDAAIEAGAAITDPSAIEAIEVRCHPLVPELMGIIAPADGLQARFSARHGIAVGLIDGRAGLAQFSDARATQPDVSRLRELTDLIPTPDCDRDSVTINVRLTGADDVEVHVAHARGSLVRPLTDAELDAKVDALIEPVLGQGFAATIRRGIEGIDTPTGFADLVTAARPAGAHA